MLASANCACMACLQLISASLVSTLPLAPDFGLHSRNLCRSLTAPSKLPLDLACLLPSGTGPGSRLRMLELRSGRVVDVTAVKGSEVAADAEAEIEITGGAGNAIVIAAYKQLIWIYME